MAFGEEVEESLDLHTATIFKQILQSPWTQIRHAFHQHVDLMKTFTFGQFIKHLEDCPLRGGKSQRPFPLPPGLDDEIPLGRAVMSDLTFLALPIETVWAAGNLRVPEQTPVVM